MPFGHPQPINRKPVARAQAYVEYGLLVAVAVIAFLVGMNALMAGATTYLAHAEPTPNATVLAGL
ncbi:MAG: hypothetical protein M3069_14660, partial [Chloroflexota bacterium]|nr:hypothetical protein [Chloroflexota bacterium]